MSVDFSVVGIFYKTIVDLTQVKGNTVGEIMQYLYTSDPNFFYTSLVFDGNQIVNSLAEYHPAPFKGRTGITYPPGMYRLSQTFTEPTPNPYSVWQYYLFDQNGTRKHNPADLSYTKAVVQDGWSIVWRLLTICNAPTGLSKRMRKLVPDSMMSAPGVS